MIDFSNSYFFFDCIGAQTSTRGTITGVVCMNMTKKNVFLTNNERNEFFRLRAAGTSRRVIQDKFKITKSTYYRILSRPIPSFASSVPAGRIKKVQKSKYFEI